MSSNVGNSALYEAGDQRNYASGEGPQSERFEEGKENSHQALDSKDERSIANRLAHAEKAEHESTPKSLEKEQREQDATLPARSHGNEPSRGAKIDQELREEDEAALKGKGSWGSKQ